MARTPVKHTSPAGRTLVACCDGTSNEPGGGDGPTNVVRLFRCLTKSDQQLVFYDPGVGTNGMLDLWRRRSNSLKAFAEQATGYGLDRHVIDVYRFLCLNHHVGDEICLFGFSRGAYTARVVAGLVHQIGLLRPEQSNLAPYALKAYKQSSDDNDLAIGWRFAREVGTRHASIRLLGLWDTVGSVIAPLKDRLGFALTHLPYTRANPSVEAVRHAIAIDERRRMFRINHWEGGDFVPNAFDRASTRPQDVKQVWFAGAHGDVGGGHAEEDSALSKIPFLWMAGEASALGLDVDLGALARVGAGENSAGTGRTYAQPDAAGTMHPQPAGWWWSLEYLPKPARMRENPDSATYFGHYLPMGETRPVPCGAMLHRSVFDRFERDPTYRPPNLPGELRGFTVEQTSPAGPAAQQSFLNAIVGKN